MRALPVLRRELGVMARRPFVYRARFFAAALGIGAAFFIFAIGHHSSERAGQLLLISVAIIAQVLALLAGVFLTADCISEERREGTLGLLFLTDLRGLDVVLGKLVAQSATAFAGLWALLPVFALPLMTGGVTLGTTLRIMLCLVLTLLLSLSLGLTVSAACRESRTAALGTLVSILLVAGIPMVTGVLLASFFPGGKAFYYAGQFSPIYGLMAGLNPNAFGADRYWSAVGILAVECVILLVRASLLTRRLWEPATERAQRRSPKQMEVQRRRRLLVPLAGERLYEWVSSRAPRSRGFCVFVSTLGVGWLAMLFLAVTTHHWEVGFTTSIILAAVMHLTLKLEFALESTRQINEDVRNGGLELVLTTSLTDREVLRGHWLGYQRRFSPALALLTFINAATLATAILFYDHLHMKDALKVFAVYLIGGILALYVDFRAIAWIGAYRALRSPTHLKATLATLAGIIGIPWLIGPPMVLAAVQMRDEETNLLIAGMLWFVVCALLSQALARRARRRLQLRPS